MFRTICIHYSLCIPKTYSDGEQHAIRDGIRFTIYVHNNLQLLRQDMTAQVHRISSTNLSVRTPSPARPTRSQTKNHHQLRHTHSRVCWDMRQRCTQTYMITTPRFFTTTRAHIPQQPAHKHTHTLTNKCFNINVKLAKLMWSMYIQVKLYWTGTTNFPRTRIFTCRYKLWTTTIWLIRYYI